MKRKVLIAGLGLIGGSLAKAIGQSHDNFIIGYDVSSETIDYAIENRVIDQYFNSFSEAAIHADVIILAMPITKTIDFIRQLNEINFNNEVIVTDVASVKGSVIEEADKLTNKNITFIGGHPMAGSHKNGIQAAKEHLFENAIYILTPTAQGANGKLAELKDTLKLTMSRFIILQPGEHDEMTSVVSHFPHLIASSLVHQAKKWENTHKFLPELAAGGFRDITRIASSNPAMWQDIFYHNSFKISGLLEEWISEMQSLQSVLADKENKKDMITYLDQAKKYRDGLDHTKKGAIRSFFDLYIDIKDQPGALAMVVQMLAVKEISITNIRILEIRDGINGALRVSVASKEAQVESYELLSKHGYEVTIEQ